MQNNQATVWSEECDKVKTLKEPDMKCEEYWYLPRWTVLNVIHRGFVWTHISSGQFDGYIKTKYLLFYDEGSACQ